MLGAEWDLRMADTLDGQARVFRESGDVTLEGEIRTRLGIEALEATLVARGDRLSLSLDGRGTELGRVEGSASVQAIRGEGGMDRSERKRDDGGDSHVKRLLSGPCGR